jgi:hypothetical protein
MSKNEENYRTDLKNKYIINMRLIKTKIKRNTNNSTKYAQIN